MVPAIAAIVAAARLARAAQVAARTAGGIKKASTVSKVYREGSAAPIARTQAQINEEGLAKARAAIGVPPKNTVAGKIAEESRKRAAESHLSKNRIKGN